MFLSVFLSDKMKIDISDIINNEDIVKPFKIVLKKEDVGEGIGMTNLSDDIIVEGELVSNQATVSLWGKISGSLKGQCYRCLKKTEQAFEIDIEEDFEPKEHISEESDIYYYKGHILDLSQAIIDTLYLNVSDRLLCKTDCKGLCIQCGQDLNLKECDCEAEEVKKRNSFSALKDFFKD